MNTKVELNLDLGKALDWLERNKAKHEARRAGFRAELTEEQLAQFKVEVDAMRNSPDRVRRRAEDAETKRRQVRDGWPMTDKSIEGFYAQSRQAGTFRVLWGNDPEDSNNASRVVTLDGDSPLWTAVLNLRIMDAWIAAETGDFVCEVRLPDIEQWEEWEQKNLYMVFSGLDGQLREHFQLNRNSQRILGVSEDGKRYAWATGDRVCISQFGTSEELYVWDEKGHAYFNCAWFLTKEKRLRLHSSYGRVLELCWEDFPTGRFACLRQRYKEARKEDDRLRLLKEEWKHHPTPSPELCALLLELFETLKIGELRDRCWYGYGKPDAWVVQMEILKALGKNNEADAVQQRLRAWRLPMECSDTAIDKVQVAVASADEAGLLALETDIRASLDSDRLKEDVHAQARLWRALGHLEEHHRRLEEAQYAYERALALNDTVGCKRDLTRVKKR